MGFLCGFSPSKAHYAKKRQIICIKRDVKLCVPRLTTDFLQWVDHQVATSVKSTWTETVCYQICFTDRVGKVQCLQQVVSVMRSDLAFFFFFFTALTAITLMLAGFKTKCDVKV